MPEFRADLARPVPPAQREELRRRIFYLDESITDFRFVTEDEQVVAVLLSTDGGPGDGLADTLAGVVEDEILAQLPAAPKVLWRSPSRRTARPDTFDGLVADGVVHEVAPGRVVLGPPALQALEALDGLLLDIVEEEFGATEYRYPATVSLAALQRSGYLSSFPQHLMFAARLTGDVATYRAFSAAAAAGEPVGGDVLGRCAPVDRCLPPTMCYHTFDQLSGTAVAAGGRVVTARGPSFRHESRYHATMERLSDFTIRETVFLGDAATVRERRDRFRQRALELVERLDLAGRCEPATDPFFAGAGGALKTTSQRLLELKHELHLDIGAGRSIAVGSFNLHDRHFGEAFDIRGADGEPAFSACVGFGLERLTYALLCQYGWDPAGWPDPVRPRRRTARPVGGER